MNKNHNMGIMMY